MVRDIVCGNEVDLQDERYRTWHEGQEFWFDSKNCKDLFDKDPGKYLKVEVQAESEVIEGSRKAREIGERAVERSKGHARRYFSEQKGFVSDTAGSISKALHDAARSLKDEQHDESANLVDRAADQLDRFSQRFRDEDTERLMRDAEDYVRSNPALSIGGALATGFLLARFIKSGSEAGRR